MSRPILRSFLEHQSGRRLGGALSTAPSAPAAFFSSTSVQAVLKDPTGRRERLNAAASALGALGTDKATPRPASHHGTDAAAKASPFSKKPATGDAQKIINVRSLPRRAEGASFPGTGVSTPRFVRAPGTIRKTGAAGAGGASSTGSLGSLGSLGRSGRFAGRPGGAGAGRRAGASAGAGGAGRKTGGQKKRRRTLRTDEDGRQKQPVPQLSEEGHAWIEGRDVGVPTAFEPTVPTLARLVGHGPAIVTGTEGGLGTAATVTRALRMLAGGMAFCDELPNTAAARDQLHAGGKVFFDSAAERAGTEAALLSKRAVKRLTKAQGSDGALQVFRPASKATRTAVLETAVRGLYAAPVSAAPGSLLATVQRYRAKDHTWSAEAGRRFDEKMLRLLPSAGGAAKAKGVAP